MQLRDLLSQEDKLTFKLKARDWSGEGKETLVLSQLRRQTIMQGVPEFSGRLGDDPSLKTLCQAVIVLQDGSHGV